MHRILKWTVLAALAALLLPAAPLRAAAVRGGKLTLRAVDAQSGKPLAVRIHLADERGRPVRPPRVPFWKDHFAFDGQITLKLATGRYTFELERGPEYKTYTGHFEIQNHAEDEKKVEMHRFVDMSRLGWWSGDLHVHREVKDIELLMRADDLHVAPVITWWRTPTSTVLAKSASGNVVQFDGDRYYRALAGEDEREGGALLYFNLNQPLDFGSATAEYPSPVTFLRNAKQQPGVHVDVEKPFWWDVPLWLASGRVDSIGLANNHVWRDGFLDNEAWGRPRDTVLFPAPHGNGRWSEAIYYHALNCGLRIPPSAGSASGVLPNPIGYNRVYVRCGGELTYDGWWEALRAGRVFVTNGPLVLTTVDGRPPGHVFTGEEGRPLELEIGLKLFTREKIEYLEIIKDGRSEHQVRLDPPPASGLRLPRIEFQRSGWFLIRAVTDNQKTYRFASTGPYYVELGGRPRISRRSAQFFLDWIDERIGRIKVDDARQREEVLAEHRQARKFWEDVLARANAD